MRNTHMLDGTRVIMNVNLTEAGEPYTVRRSWLERLFSCPWQPFTATRTITPQVPMRGGYELTNGTLMMHPETFRQMKAMLASAGAAKEKNT